MFEEEHNKVLLTVIVGGVLLSLFLVTVFILSVIRYKRRIAEDLKEKLAMKKSFEQALLQSQIEVQESTLSTLSKDLHDNIGQLLSTVKVLFYFNRCEHACDGWNCNCFLVERKFFCY